MKSEGLYVGLHSSGFVSGCVDNVEILCIFGIVITSEAGLLSLNHLGVVQKEYIRHMAYSTPDLRVRAQ